MITKGIRADFALINVYNIDKTGNVWSKGTKRNFNQVMATVADTVMADADNLVEISSIEPEDVMTPGILVDYIACAKGE